MLIFGIDCAAQEKNVGLAAGRFDGKKVRFTDLRPDSSGGSVCTRILDNLSGEPTALLALDAPLGWPKALGQELRRHSAGRPIATQPNDLFRRLTDHATRASISKVPMDVGADRIARAAHAALRLIGDLEAGLGCRIPLAWAPPVGPGVWAIEVYPGGFLKANGVTASGYKEPDAQGMRRTMLEALRAFYPLEEPEGRDCTVDQHLFDAALCVLSATDFLTGRSVPPREAQRARAVKEGWIWTRGPRLPML
ncbi:MAG TPA: DUF429 domain-containing protein [Spirochaetia bacterium]|nr:DUF429 domain-containing protein [Spirochaetia bacterium]